MAVPQEKIVKVKVLTLFYYSRTRMREKSFLKNVYVNKFLSVA